jgi:small subunit ribosomal protein S3Ae
MAEKKSKVFDKWKTKKWYSVIAPEIFESKEIGQIVSSDESNLIGRKIKVGLGELSGSFSQLTAYVSVFFKIKEVKGQTAHTYFVGHELMPGYVRTLARRKRSVIHLVNDVSTKDNFKIRVKSLCITGVKVSEDVRKDIRKQMSEQITEIAKNLDFSSFVQEIIFGKLAMKVFNAIKKIGPIKRVEIRKSELLESKRSSS